MITTKRVQRMVDRLRDKKFKFKYYSLYDPKIHTDWTILKPEELLVAYYEQRMTHERMAEKFGVSRTEITILMTEIREFLKKSGMTIHSRWEEKKLPEKLTGDNPHLGYILGVTYGDACIKNGTFKFGVIDKDFRNKVEKELVALGFSRKVFRKKYIGKRDMGSPYGSKIYKCKPIYKISIHSQRFTNFLEQFDLNRMNTKQKKGFIEGFFDSEGHVTNPSGSKNIGISNTNKTMINIIDDILDDFDIEHKVYYVHRRHKKSVVTGRRFKDIYRLLIMKNSEMIKFHDHFKLSIKRKQKRLNDIVKQIKTKHPSLLQTTV
jgi:hypothetical protein